MKEIKLTLGRVTVVSDEDYDRIKHIRWFSGARQTSVIGKNRETGKTVTLSRLILGVTDPKIYVDHIDGNPFNNQRHNLRLCTPGENTRNRGKDTRKASSPYKGVFWKREENSWAAAISVNRVKYRLGFFITEEAAAEAYNAAALKYHGAFARLNKIDYENVSGRKSKPRRVNTSKYKGVYWGKADKKWKATISQLGLPKELRKQLHLGYFDTEEEAAKAWNKAAIKYGLDPNKLNKIE